MIRPRKSKGFTLIEIMVAIAILAVIMVLISKAVSMVSATWRSGIARVDNFSQARAVLNLVNQDIQGIVLRPDVAAFVDANGDPAFAFYSQVSGTQISASDTAVRRLSLVEYSLNQSTTPPLFQRKDAGYSYSPTATNALSLNQGNKLPGLASLNPAQAQTLSEGILYFRWQTLNGKAEIGSTFQYEDTVPGDLTKTRAIIISLLVLDSNAFHTAQQSNLLSTIRGKFSATPASDHTYAQTWNGILKTPGFGSDLPPQLRNGIRTFERYIPLPSAIHQE